MRFLWALVLIVFVWPLAGFVQMLHNWQCHLAGWRAKLDEKRQQILNRRK